MASQRPPNAFQTLCSRPYPFAIGTLFGFSDFPLSFFRHNLSERKD